MGRFCWNRKNRIRSTVLGALVCIGIGAAWEPVSAKEDDDGSKDAEAEVDHLGLAARLIQDEHFDRALSVLSEVDQNAKTFDGVRFFTLRGLANLQQQNYEEARKDFDTAIKRGQKDKSIELYRAQACFKLEQYKCVLSAIAKSGKSSTESAALLMKSESEWKLGRKESAIATLQKGEKSFQDNPEFQRLQVFYFIDLGLYLEAVAVSNRYLSRDNIKAADYVAIAEALRAANAYDRAQVMMEGARLRYPENEQVLVQLAHCYLGAEKKISAAMVFEEAARLNSKYTFEAAELYKEAGLLFRAEWLNARVADQKNKTKQRLSLLVEAQDFDAVTAMIPKLERLRLLEDDSIRYAVAYAFYKTGQFGPAEEHLKPIKDPQLFESALQLRKAMASCREAGWDCIP